MSNIKIKDIVTSSRRKGKFKVIDKRNSGSSTEIRIQSLDNPADVDWIYEAHCVVDVRASIQNRKDEAAKILNKPINKRGK